MPLYQWVCPKCRTTTDEFIPLSEVEAGRHPSAETRVCPDCGTVSVYQWTRNCSVALDFPLHDAGDRYQDSLAAEAEEKKRPLVERYEEAQAQKKWRARQARGDGKVVVSG